ncbi:hypothetical protein [Salinispora fenicalii]|uniref:hypothetical protein n=1 Tax=Salinispora fenicalii TaxID=1137263 RepID=UPI00165F1EBC|nr:hypothetical protein [Salinispora fenicalii]
MVLLVAGLADGSSILLVVSIAASLLAAVALVVGARQAAAARAAAERTPSEAHRGGGSAYRQPDGFLLPGQQAPPPIDHGGTGWRQPPGLPVAGVEPVADDGPAPPAVSPAEAARLARMDREVWVVDGHSDYHLAGCSRLLGEPEPLPVAEAIDLGFTPCIPCAPVAALLAEEGQIASGGAGA